MKRDKKLRKIFKNALIKKITKNNKLISICCILILFGHVLPMHCNEALRQLQGKKRASILSLFEKYP